MQSRCCAEMLRSYCLLPTWVVLSAITHTANSYSTATLTVPTVVESVTLVESIITTTLKDDSALASPITGRGRERVDATSVEDQIILSTIIETSTILVSSYTILVTTIDHDNATPLPNSSRTTTRHALIPDTIAHSTSSASPAEARPTYDTPSNVLNADEDHSTSNSGLSAGSKAGIAIGTLFGVLLLCCLTYFCLKARSEARPRSSTLGLHSWSDEERDTPPRSTSEKQREAAHTEPKAKQDIGPEEMLQPAYVANPRYSENMNLTGIVFEDRDEDEPMYVGVPAHLTGGKRWSVPAAGRQ